MSYPVALTGAARVKRMSTADRIEQKLETIADLLETARALVEALETGATAESEADIDHAVTEARQMARSIIEAR